MMASNRHYCFNCGADIGPKDRFSEPLDDCGALECVREARNAYQQERDEAHEQLDRDMGWY
ncbi:hypothetical protein YP76_06880 [Sphingobium chungbukense]|uniref:Uncharacterized protein n=2 Tax=Sphingobium chungbukense TaxID=56193 RepID=A0A0M3AVP6_9SPHN|nr:hypothetical protein YP76_06880 [Sphingobium chungbukense]